MFLRNFLEHWHLNAIMYPVISVTPTWSKVLHAATEPSKKKVEVGSDPRNRSTVCLCLMFSIYSGTAITFSDQEYDSRICSLSSLTCLLQSSDFTNCWGLRQSFSSCTSSRQHRRFHFNFRRATRKHAEYKSSQGHFQSFMNF